VLARVFRLDAETHQVKAGEEWSTSSLQSPDDLEAIYQKKRGQGQQGFVFNVSETYDLQNRRTQCS